MPELPEVETLRRGLSRNALGRRIIRADITRPELLRTQSEEEFQTRILGGLLSASRRRGKYLLLDLESPHHSPITVCIHLKMRGQLRLESSDKPLSPYSCVTLHLEDGQAIRYNDMWRWGEVRALTAEEQDTLLPLREMGPEPLEDEWTVEIFAAALGKRRVALKSVLLDQRVLAGVGNIYADESLFAANIHPKRLANSLLQEEIIRLHHEIRRILSLASDAGGTHSEEFVDLAGLPGRYRPLVYDRGGNVCDVCGGVLEKIKLGGRGTTFCVSCQR